MLQLLGQGMVGLLSQMRPSGGGSGTPGVSALDDLTDVVIASPVDGQVLSYDDGTSKWVNENPSALALDINGLTEVREPHVRNDFIPIYNGAASANRKIQLSTIRQNRRYGVQVVTPTTTTSFNTEGMGTSTPGGNTTSNPTSTSYYTSFLRQQYSCLAVAKRAVSGQAYWFRGDGTVCGGIYLSILFGVQFGSAPTGTAGCRIFIGLRDDNAQIAADPSTVTDIGCVGLAKDDTDTGWYIIHATNGSTPTKVACGGSFPAADTIYELTLYCPNNTASVAYQLWNKSTGASVGSGTLTTNLPGGATGLYWFFGIQGLDAGNSSIMDFVQVTVEGDIS